VEFWKVRSWSRGVEFEEVGQEEWSKKLIKRGGVRSWSRG
jgi:hypothetical protein